MPKFSVVEVDLHHVNYIPISCCVVEYLKPRGVVRRLTVPLVVWI